tara:strand:- start:1238 stop:1531 length:294 start_codon:yes stop_codon:yes gene_type:complete
MIKKILLLLLLLICVNKVNSNRRILINNGGIIWDRIPKYMVKEKVYNFLDENGVNNCFQHIENKDLMLLKCWINNMLVDITIELTYDNRHKTLELYI